MKLTYPFITILFCLFAFTPQNAKCADKQEIDNLIDSLANADDRSSDRIPILYELDSLSRAIGYNTGIIYANIQLCYEYRIIDPEKVYEHVSITDEILKQDPESFTLDNLVSHYLIKGYNLGERGNSFQELRLYLKADTLAAEDSTGRLTQGVNFLLSSYYISEKEYEKALAINTKIITYYAELTDDKKAKHSYVMSIHNAGSIHLEMKNYDSTVFYMLKALDNGIGDYASGPWMSYLHLSQCYTELGEYDKAAYYLKLFENNPLPPYSRLWVRYYLLNGNFEYKKEAFIDASVYYNEALIKSDSIGWSKGSELANFSILKSELSAQNQLHLVKYLTNYDSLKNVFANTNTEKYEKQLLIQFETSEKEAKIAHLAEENANRKYLFVRIIALSLLVILILLLIVYKYKSSKNKLAHQLEREQKDRKITKSKLTGAIERLNDKNAVIEQLKADLEKIETSKDSIGQISQLLDRNYVYENQWVEIFFHFDELYDNFTKRIVQRYETLTKNDIQLLILIQLEYSNKSIALIKNISEAGIKKGKQRLMKKMSLTNSSDLKRLDEFLNAATPSA